MGEHPHDELDTCNSSRSIHYQTHDLEQISSILQKSGSNATDDCYDARRSHSCQTLHEVSCLRLTSCTSSTSLADGYSDEDKDSEFFQLGEPACTTACGRHLSPRITSSTSTNLSATPLREKNEAISKSNMSPRVPAKEPPDSDRCRLLDSFLRRRSHDSLDRSQEELTSHVPVSLVPPPPPSDAMPKIPPSSPIDAMPIIPPSSPRFDAPLVSMNFMLLRRFD